MIRKIIASVVVVLALGAGAAYAATQLASADGTQVCVNDGSGLMRVASTCRASEHPMTIGGGTSVTVTRSGTFTVDWGATSAPKALPLTGVTISGKCQIVTEPGYPDQGLAKIVISAPSGTMDAIAIGIGTIGGTTVTTYELVRASTSVSSNTGTGIVTANGATATITFGAQVNPTTTPKTCTYLWQATEAPN